MAKTSRPAGLTSNGNNGSKWIRPLKRMAIYLRDGFRCVYCTADLRAVKAYDVTLDHVISGHQAGNHHETNLVTACRSCNSRKADIPVEEFTDYVTLVRVEKARATDLRPFLALVHSIAK